MPVEAALLGRSRWMPLSTRKLQMTTKISLYPLYGVADHIDGEVFDHSVLPFDVIRGVTVEDVRVIFNEDTFKWVGREMGRHDLEELQRVRYALVHRYQAPQPGEG